MKMKVMRSSRDTGTLRLVGTLLSVGQYTLPRRSHDPQQPVRAGGGNASMNRVTGAEEGDPRAAECMLANYSAEPCVYKSLHTFTGAVSLA